MQRLKVILYGCGVALAFLLLASATRANVPAVCTGDCDGNGVVTVDELVRGVNIALGAATIDVCAACDANGNGVVTVDELITSVNAALGGCPAAARYVGWETCEGCHAEQYTAVVESGHPYKLVSTNGQPPVPLANDSLTPKGNYAPAPPAGYSWSDISYIIGGWGWKERFIDRQGYIITCPPGDTDADGDGYCDTLCAGSTPGTCDAAAADAFEGQWNLFAESGSPSEWVPYHMGQYRKKYSCGTCHTTGYDPETPTPGMPGIVGSWSEPGVRCEACHGPGSLHIAEPTAVAMQVDRSSALCGGCHVRGSADAINASGGFIRHHEQWDEFSQLEKSRHVSCIDCHDPHQSARFDLDAGLTNMDPGGESIGIRTTCESCHQEEAKQQKSAVMGALNTCADCHMPRAAKSALAVGPFAADVRSHLFRIDTDPAAEQFSADGKTANPYLSLNFACRGCHGTVEGDPQPNSVKTDAALAACAVGYHDSGPVAGYCQ